MNIDKNYNSTFGITVDDNYEKLNDKLTLLCNQITEEECSNDVYAIEIYNRFCKQETEKDY